MVKIFGIEFGRDTPPPTPPVISVDDLNPSAFFSNPQNTLFDGDKFLGGFGATELQEVDYWTLRTRSDQLFNDNLYARGIIRRLVTNEINTGLIPEVSPDEGVIGVPEDSLADWSEIVENRFAVWGANPNVCDFRKRDTFGALQRAVRTEALVSGDVLVVLRQSRTTKLPAVQLVNGSRVQTPFFEGQSKLRAGHTIRHGVELNAAGHIVAYWVKQDGEDFERLPAVGRKSGRTLAWLVYGTDKRFDDLRGQPLLSLILQSLKEIDRYRDSVQRKAVINSILAMYIQKDQDKIGTLPVTGGAVRKDTVTATGGDAGGRNFSLAGQIPGLVMEELQYGEKPVGFHSQGVDMSFGPFEEAIVQTLAWTNEIPPEILRLAFSNNYSASQAAINEFKIYLERIRAQFGETFCTPIYIDWLISETLLRKVSAPGFLDAWRDPLRQDVYTAWSMADWYGSIKPSTDMLKAVKASEMLLTNGLTTHAREARLLTGTKFSKNVKRLRRENEMIVDANAPIAEAERAAMPAPADATTAAIATDVKAMVELLDGVTADAI